MIASPTASSPIKISDYVRAFPTNILKTNHIFFLPLSSSPLYIYIYVCPSCSFREGKASSSESAIVGISKDTPGAIYDASIDGSKASARTTRLPLTDRFYARSNAFAFPGPGHYAAAGQSLGAPASGAVSWTGPQTFTESEWCRYYWSSAACRLCRCFCDRRYLTKERR